ncbi:MAG: 16S rRNA (cytosine(1402)-N(4))-methyltransferase RsmH [Candidatus Colwellbacteria bacterium]|nr:16S rRNA (cytosine(1402)-N(4))-methyltransferase RsmH [Candidatus Colwellbacteria bacterium]
MAQIPVLLNQVLEALELASPKQGEGGLSPGKFIIDGTLGVGGHAKEIIKQITPGGIFLGLDWDEVAVDRFEESAKELKADSVKIILKNRNYADLPEVLKEEKLGQADGLLLDLGFSTEQLEIGRGFSFNRDEPLTMTYNAKRPPTSEILRRLKQDELERIIRDSSNERYAKRIAAAIYEREKEKPITTSGELAEIIRRAVPRGYERGRIDPATRTFMALRIYVNDEIENIEQLLQNLTKIVKSGGRIAIISFHSLEDRLVKNRFREGAKRGELKLVTKKPIRATSDEIRENSRSRSAKLRVAEVI